MKLYYHVDRYGNFGDDLNDWLWAEFLPQGFFDDDESDVFIGMGSLLGDGLQHSTAGARRRIVMGTGSGYRPPMPLGPSWDVRFVRGPRTAARFSLDPALAITDPGVLVSQLPHPAQPARSVSYMPHHSSLHFGDWDEICALAGLRFVDPRWGGRKVLASIRSSRLLLTEALHGAIAADAMRVPWIPIRAYPEILEFKWFDWADSMNLEIEFSDVAPVYRSSFSYPVTEQIKNVLKKIMLRMRVRSFDVVRPMIGSSAECKNEVAASLRYIAENRTPILSSARVLERRVDQILTEVEKLAREVG